MSDLATTTVDLATADLTTATADRATSTAEHTASKGQLPADLSVDGREMPPVSRIRWVRNLAVTTAIVVLVALSFVIGRASHHDSSITRAETIRPASAGLSLQAERAAQARLDRANGAAVSITGQQPQNQRAAQARLLQANPTVVSDAGHNVLSLCAPNVPC